MCEVLSIERDGYRAAMGLATKYGRWAAIWVWEADAGLLRDGHTQPYPDRAQAICGGARALLESLESADRDEAEFYLPNPAVTGVARRRMERIRLWAEELAAKHRPVAQAVPLFGGDA